MNLHLAIVGGGIMGTLAALALAGRGHRVSLFESRARLLEGASRNNEGKIHLGFTYGLDPTGETPRVMARYGSAFMASLSALVPDLPRAALLANEVVYARHRASVLDADGIAAHLARTAGLMPSADDRPPVRRLPPEAVDHQFGDAVTDAFIVREPTVAPAVIGAAIMAAVAGEPAIEVTTLTRVGRIEDGPRPAVYDATDRLLGRYDAVVNCAWDGLPALNRSNGLPSGGFCLRAKAGFVARGTGFRTGLPVTFCYGSFGDVVPLGDDRLYVSWYPSCLMGLTTDLATGTNWFAERMAGFDATAAYAEAAHTFATLCRGLTLADEFDEVLAGAILAAGRTDIDDPDSGLHRRTAIGIHRKGALFSVNTGKLTCAPLMALELAGMVGP